MEPGNIRTPIALLVIAIILVVVSLVVFNAVPSAPARFATTMATSSAKAIPAITPGEKQQLAQEPTFSALVSYTDRGFEPSHLTVQKGDTIRFTNNSSHEVWVAATAASGAMYPAGGVGCGTSALDSCGPIEPGNFWQFTFTQSGTWSYQNNLNTADTGVVEVN